MGMNGFTRMYLWGPEGAGPMPLRRGHRLLVQAWEQALVFRRGALVETLGPGAYRRWRGAQVVRVVDTRSWTVVLPTQEVPIADGVPVKVTVAAVARVVDAAAFVTGSQDPHAALYLAVQVALRAVVTGMPLDELLTGRGAIGSLLLASVIGIDDLGVAVDSLEVKDIVLPAEVKRAQVEVLVAKAEGLAALERARGETAALRSLANGARLAADNPALLHLRLFQQLAATTGHTVVIGTPPMLPA
jgi:regulator of protease activity HflC (stomatin/prohibitin superfamily)